MIVPTVQTRTKRIRGAGAFTMFLQRAWAITLLSSIYAFGQQAVLLVCIPGKQNTPSIQSGLDGLVGQGKTLVFGRIKDLEGAMATAPDAAIIASESFFKYTGGYTIALAGKMGGASSGKYLLVAASKEITMDNIKDKKVGIVDFLGKERISLFIKEYFGVDIKMLKRANKEEDLLTMLGIEAADAIIVSNFQYKEILSNTKLPLTIVASSSSNVGLAGFAVRSGKADEKLKKTIQNAPASLLKEIGITGWEVR